MILNSLLNKVQSQFPLKIIIGVLLNKYTIDLIIHFSILEHLYIFLSFAFMSNVALIFL